MYDIYSSNHQDTWRFTLGKLGNRNLLTIGLNPSTATREKSDPTVKRVENVAQRNGFDGFVMLNLYPVRATDYRSLPSQVDEDAFSENLQRIEVVVASEEEPTIWAAWGESIVYHRFFVQACREIFVWQKGKRVTWTHFGDMTASGHPRHPSRISYAWRFLPLDAERYLNALES